MTQTITQVFLDAGLILSAADLKTETVEVPEWGGALRISQFSSEARAEIDLARYKAFKAMSAGDDTVLLDLAKITTPLYLLHGVVDQNGNPVFTRDQMPAMLKKNPAVLNRVAQKIAALNGMDEGAVDAEVKN